jgi:hypothetical protein
MRNYRIITDDESEEIRKEAVIDYFKAQSQHSLRDDATLSTVLSIILIK